MLHHIAFDVLDYAFNGRERGQRGNDHLVFAPYGVFPCAGEDRWIAIACTSDAAFLALLQQLDAAGLADDERTGGLGGRTSVTGLPSTRRVTKDPAQRAPGRAAWLHEGGGGVRVRGHGRA